MISFRIPATVAVVAGLVLAAGCGHGAASRSGGSAAPATPGDPGPGAAFAPAGSLLYVRTPGAGAAWQAMTRVRAHVRGLNGFDPEDSMGNLVRLMVGADFAEGPKQMFRSLTGESSEVVVSRRAVRGEDGSPTTDAFFYSQVSDRDGLARWLAPHYTRTGSDGAFSLYRGRGHWVGYSALSDTAWLWAGSETTLREAIATAAGKDPSIASDGRFTSAFSGLDARGAALVGYTRGDLAGGLRKLWMRDGQPSGTQTLTDALGLADTAFAIGANSRGVWLRAAPHLPANGYRPGPLFSPSLFDEAPAGSWMYLGVADGGAQLGAFDRLVAPLMGATTPDLHGVDRLLHDFYGLAPSDLAAIGAGEQAWFVGPTDGAAFRPNDADRAARTLAAVAGRYAGQGFQSGRNGDVVWLHGHPGSGRGRAPVPSMAALVDHAGLEGPVSWIGAVNVRGLFSGWSEDGANPSSTPQQAVVGAVLTVAPGAAGRYRLQAYLDFGA
ncbi:MAG TPA: hypothetical protein VFW14_19810 [Gaiellales bacterium]|nr:hypothetical protein [Gaiellales bacterium]